MTVHDADLRSATAPLATADPTEAGGVLTIDLAAVESNWKRLAGLTVPVECAAVVKADGYGCGLEPVTRTLHRAGCRTFFVADVAEGRRARTVAPDATIYVLNGVMPGSAQAFAADHLRPVINSTTELAEWDAFVATKNWRGGAALHVDTGMNRLGITVEEAAAIAPRLQSENHGFTLVMSHLACAESPDHPMNARQLRLFRDIRMAYRGVASSLANSSGIFLGERAYCDLVRPGVALYGVNPTPGKANPMRRVVELKGRIIQVRTIDKGETVGYGAAFTAGRASRIAIIAVGYADGFLRSAGTARGKPAAEVIVAGKRCPLAGRVSMDVLAVDVTDVAEGAVRRGDFATLIGDRVSVDDLAAGMGTIGYEVLTDLGRRYHRLYKGG
ncbi:MAG TPA: alanine racemase [Xanthobacteraceae bacterium]|jgi:alanine racemase|nr:alanine racemase [Xanthobacteraceae bacterium]